MLIFSLVLFALQGCKTTSLHHNQISTISSQKEENFINAYKKSSIINGDLASWIIIALKNNPKLKALFDQWQSQLYLSIQSNKLPDPKISFTHFIEEIQTRTGPQRNRIMLSQSMPWFGTLSQRSNVAKQQSEVLWKTFKRECFDVVLNVKHIYFELGYLNQVIQITENNLTLLKQLESVVQRKIQVGSNQNSLIRLQVEIGKIQNQLKTFYNKKPALEAKFKAILNMDFNEEIEWPTLLMPDVKNYSRNDLLAYVFYNNADLNISHEKINHAKENLNLSYKEIWPDITLGVSFIDTGDALDPASIGSGEDPIGISLTFSLPLWFEKNNASISVAKNLLSSEQNLHQNLKNSIHVDLEFKLYKLDDAIRQIHLYKNTLLPRAKQAYEITLTSYQSAKASILDLIDAERTLLEFERLMYRAITDYEQALAEIENICGGNLP